MPYAPAHDPAAHRNDLGAEISHALRSLWPVGARHAEGELLADWRFLRGAWDSVLTLRPEQRVLRVYRALKFGAACFGLGAFVPLYFQFAPHLTAPRRGPAFIGPQLPPFTPPQLAGWASLAAAAAALTWVGYRIVDRYALWNRAVRVRIYPFGLALNSHLVRWDGPGERVTVEPLKAHPHGLVFAMMHPSRRDPMNVTVTRVAVLAPDLGAREEILRRFAEAVARPPVTLRRVA